MKDDEKMIADLLEVVSNVEKDVTKMVKAKATIGDLREKMQDALTHLLACKSLMLDSIFLCQEYEEAFAEKKGGVA